MASIYNLVENKNNDPLNIVDSKVKLIEHITKSPTKEKKNNIMESYNVKDSNTRLLTQKILLEKFNEKYKGLGENQKILLQEYVNSVSNSPSLKTYINSEIKKVKSQLTKYASKVNDKVISIKLMEAKNLIKPLCKKSSVHDDNVSNLLNYYRLINELKSIHV
jgi:Asp-tRNA(Asn)/Glu-tRNA(Gln) amidotransferase B subunit